MSGRDDPSRKNDPGTEELRVAPSPESLVGGSTLATNFASASAAGDAGDHGGRIGPFVLIRKLGEGGMGQVWLAMQTAPVERQVALKLIRGGVYDSTVVQRFQSERQAIAIMNHPAIAKVYDAGTTPDGQPYFAMEYVCGMPITQYCDENKLKVKERLELLVRVCAGVQHAHQKAIIHRDLKPSNILVAEVDGKPQPRIIDFGIAKAVSGVASADQTIFTQAGALIGTPGYMSPEQANADVEDVDTRTDVYSLGVVLYVLLTGMLPFESGGRERVAVHEVLRRVREDDPPSPSTRVEKAEPLTSTETAQKRSTEPRQLARLLKGDLDWIALKALEKDRTRRYGTPTELATDLERYLHNLPVVARPASAGYRLRKYVQRHRVGVLAAMVVAGVLVAFAVTEAVQLKRTIRERDRADRIAEFMTGIFKVADPGESKGNSVTAREILDNASKDVETGLKKDPELQSRMMTTMSHAYINLGLLAPSEKLLERSLETRKRLFGARSKETVLPMSQLGFVLLKQGKFADAEKLLREAVATGKESGDMNDVTTISAKRYLAAALEFQGKYAEAEAVQRQSLNDAIRLLGPEHWETLLSMNVMANILDDEGKLKEAEQLYRETAEVQTRTLGAEHPDTLTSKSNLAAVIEEQGRFPEAENMQRETLEARQRVLGKEHQDTLAVMHNLANTLHAAGRMSESEDMFRETLEIQRRVDGPEHPDTLQTMANLANTLHDQKKDGEAESLYVATIAGRHRVLGPEHPETVKSERELAEIFAREGKYPEAKKLYEELIHVANKAQDRPRLAALWYDFACGAGVAGLRADALEHLRHAVENGFANVDHLLKDDDLKLLRSEAQFAALTEAVRQNASQTPQK